MDGGIDAALVMAREAARICGLDPSGASSMRERASILIRLPAAGAVARVESPARGFLAERMAAIARVAEPRGAPLVELLVPERQPLVFDAGAVTVWRYIEGRHASFDEYEQIGAILRVLHDTTRPLAADPELPRFDPFDELAVWFDELEADGYPARELGRLREHEARLAATWADVAADSSLDWVVIHGDVHHENVLIGSEGPRFVDLEMSGVGPAGWDFATLAAGVHRYGVPSAIFDALVRGYGRDPRGGARLGWFRELYEFICAVWAASCRHVSPQMVAEAELRVAAVLGHSGDPGPRWTLL